MRYSAFTGVFITFVAGLFTDALEYDRLLNYPCVPGKTGDTGCGLSCISFQSYRNGICRKTDNLCYCELIYTRPYYNKKPEPIDEICSGDVDDKSCAMKCLDYPRYHGGKCNRKENRCYCGLQIN